MSILKRKVILGLNNCLHKKNRRGVLWCPQRHMTPVLLQHKLYVGVGRCPFFKHANTQCLAGRRCWWVLAALSFTPKIGAKWSYAMNFKGARLFPQSSFSYLGQAHTLWKQQQNVHNLLFFLNLTVLRFHLLLLQVVWLSWKPENP